MTIEFNNQINTSVQVGDVAYYAVLSSSGGYGASESIFKIGEIEFINRTTEPYSIVCDTNLLAADVENNFIRFRNK